MRSAASRDSGLPRIRTAARAAAATAFGSVALGGLVPPKHPGAPDDPPDDGGHEANGDKPGRVRPGSKKRDSQADEPSLPAQRLALVCALWYLDHPYTVALASLARMIDLRPHLLTGGGLWLTTPSRQRLRPTFRGS